jgi:hypothetical protein
LVTGYILAMSAIAVVWGLLVKSTQAAEAFSFIVLFLPYLSDGFVPAATMPRLLRGFAEHQPITPLVETVRALLLDQPIGNAGWIAAGGSPWGGDQRPDRRRALPPANDLVSLAAASGPPGWDLASTLRARRGCGISRRWACRESFSLPDYQLPAPAGALAQPS